MIQFKVVHMIVITHDVRKTLNQKFNWLPTRNEKLIKLLKNYLFYIKVCFQLETMEDLKIGDIITCHTNLQPREIIVNTI